MFFSESQQAVSQTGLFEAVSLILLYKRQPIVETQMHTKLHTPLYQF